MGRKRIQGPALIAAIVTLGIVALGVGLAAAGATMAATDGIGPVVLEAGLQILVVVLIGAIAGWLVRSVETAREEARERNEYRMALLRSTVDAYNQVKEARRTLRAFGFAPEMDALLSGAQVEEFVRQMRSVNTAQLQLEALKRQVRSGAGEFRYAGDLEDQLRTADAFIGDVIDDWEKVGPGFHRGNASAMGSAVHLQAFLKHEDEDFEARLIRPMARIQRVIAAEVSGREPPVAEDSTVA